MIINRFVTIVVPALILGTPGLRVAQSERGSITGVVMDSTEAAVPGVSIEVINTATRDE